jgi:hypothetical protein
MHLGPKGPDHQHVIPVNWELYKMPTKETHENASNVIEFKPKLARKRRRLSWETDKEYLLSSFTEAELRALTCIGASGFYANDERSLNGFIDYHGGLLNCFLKIIRHMNRAAAKERKLRRRLRRLSADR